MEDDARDLIETLLPGYFSDNLTADEQRAVEDWREATEENAVLFEEYHRLWKSMGLLKEMESIDTVRALDAVNRRIGSAGTLSKRFITTMSRVAAILFIPLLCYTLFAAFTGKSFTGNTKSDVAWQTITTGVGMRGTINLPDGSSVTLNSGSEMKYPTRFTKGTREVQLTGEAFFEVVRDVRHPFIVNTGDLNVEVLGTTFNVSAYDDDKPVEVVLATGKIALFTEEGGRKKSLGLLDPGQRAVYDHTGNKLSVAGVDAEKYTAWRDGELIFRDDSMSDVISRLERWFNVDIVVDDDHILDYEITARFRDETLDQVLNLLKLSSAIEYSVDRSSQLKDGDFTRTTIHLKRR